MIKLNDITEQILFDESAHTYTRVSDGKVLTGVTTLMKNVGVSADYSGINEEILARAAETGTLIHRLCEMTHSCDNELTELDALEVYQDLKDKGLIKYIEEPCGHELANSYKNILSTASYKHLVSEYLVSDGENIASSIDIVLTTDQLEKQNKVILVDIKTTSSIHKEPLSWQLCIYKELFEKQNPGIEVVDMFGIWLPKERYGRPSLVSINTKSSKEVSNIIECFLKGEKYPELPEVSFCPPDAVVDSFKEYIQAKEAIKKATEIVKKFEENLLCMFDSNDIKKWEFENATFTRKLPTTRKTFDSKKFEKDNPELYNNYVKESQTKSSLLVTIK